jgi:biopolymer transport protein ExbD
MSKPVTNIEITPLVGVALILVIVFIVTSPLIMAPVDMEISLPKAATTEAKSELNITISLTDEGELALNEDKIQQSELVAKLKSKLSDDPDRLVVIRADKNVKHKSILALLTMAKKAGAQNLALATEQRSRPVQGAISQKQ